MAALLPTDFASQEEYSTYYLALPGNFAHHKADLTASEEAEMIAVYALVPRDETTKLFAVVFGNWNTDSNWYPNGVPGAGAKVLIGEGCTCTYNVNAVLTELFTVRVDGKLCTDPTLDTAMLFDTMVISGTGLLQDGTRTARVASDVVHQWIIATSNGLVDVVWDTFFQSRGIVSLGRVDIWGHHKTPFLDVASHMGPSAGATSLNLASVPTDWAVGDEIVIGATRSVDAYFSFPENELRTLTSVAGAVIGWTGGLTYSHAGPQGSVGRTDLKCTVANLTRNVVFRPDDPDTPIHHRGHLMQMHNYNGWSMRDAEIADLGRTAKHGGYTNTIFYQTTPVMAGAPLDLTQYQYWDGAKIVFGPTFLLRGEFVASAIGTLTVVGTDEDGAAQTEVMDYVAGANNHLSWQKFFLTITSITPSTIIDDITLRVDARSRQRNENGTRSLQSGAPVHSAIKNTQNIQGRYPFHWHKMGLTGDIKLNPPVLDGCSIHGSPGWLMAHHQSHGIVKNCVGYDAPGSGWVGEDGNETGLWDNIRTFHHVGNGDTTNKNAFDYLQKDPARSGAGFTFTGRQIHVNNCIAIGCQAGHVYNVRPAGAWNGTSALFLTPATFEQPTCLRGRTANIDISHVPISHFDNCGAVAVVSGFDVIKAEQNQYHDIRTPLRNFKVWSCQTGGSISYTEHYSMISWDCVLGNANYARAASIGVSFFQNVADQAVVNPIIDGFLDGIDLFHGHAGDSPSGEGGVVATDPLNGRDVVNPTFHACTDNYTNYNASIDHLLTTGDLNSDPLTLTSLVASGGLITGTKHDELGDVTYPYGFDDMIYTRSLLLTAYGYYVDADSKKYTMSDEWFTSRLTGELNKVILPIEVTDLALGAYTNNGACDLANNTPPVFADFTVSLTRNTNLVIDILARASGNTIRFGGMWHPMKTVLVDNGDGTITAVPLADENYSETCYVWVDDINGNTTRATMTMNVT